MKKQIRLSMLVLAGIFFADAALAADGKIGFINDPQLAQESTALQGLQMQRDNLVTSLKTQVEKEATAIVEKRKELAEQEKTLSKAELGEKLDEIEKAEVDLQQRAQKAGAELQENFTKALIEFKEKTINPVVRELAKEKGFSAIINAASAFYMDTELDVTEEAIARMNKKTPKMEFKKVTMSAAKTAKPATKKSKK